LFSFRKTLLSKPAQARLRFLAERSPHTEKTQHKPVMKGLNEILC